MTDTSTDTCKVDVWDGGRSFHFHECGRSVKGTSKNGEPVCGVHLRAGRERDRKAAEYRDRLAVEAEFKERMRELGEKHHIEVHTRLQPYGPGFNLDIEHVVLSVSDLKNILGER